MDLVRRFIRAWRERRAIEAEGEIRGWHDACRTVVEGCSQGLRDPRLPRADIGVTLDQIDRALFRVRDAGSGAQQALRGRAPGIAARIRRSTEALIELRNETATFLIRAQGPTPAFLQTRETAPGQAEAYQRAVQEVGQGASARVLAVERDLDRLWRELQPYLSRSSDPTGTAGRAP